jgi:hypothetical protein
MAAAPTPKVPTTNRFLLEDLQDAERTRDLGGDDLHALRAIADWITTFVARPHKDLGRRGPVCPFVPGALERQMLGLAPEQTANRSAQEVFEIIEGYKTLFLRTAPTEGDGVDLKAFVVVFTDLAAERAKAYFDQVEQDIKTTSYAEDGVVMGEFYETNDGSAIYNPSFRPFTPPVPFLLMRQTVISDWKFFLDDDVWLDLWARRFGVAAVTALAEELRRLPWRTPHD